MLTAADLPDDIAALKALLLASERRVQERDDQVAGLEAQLNTRAAEIEHLKLRIPRKLDTRSAANWTLVPAQTGQLFHAKLDTWGVTARGRGCGFTPDGSGLSNRPVFFASNLLSS